MSNTQILSGNVSVQAVEEQINRPTGTNANFSKSTFDEKNYLNLKLNPGETTRKVKIRILPVSETDSRFCMVVKTHSLKLSKKIAKSGFKSFPCLNDVNVTVKDSRGCPLCNKAQEFFAAAKEARDGGNAELSKTLYKQACSYLPKDTYIVRVIERGKENEGVKFWRFNANSKKEGYFDKLIALYKTRQEEMAEAGMGENYNIFDLNNGRDIVLTLTKTVNSAGVEATAVQLADASISTPLSQDVEQANAWIKDSKVWTDAYAIKDFEYLAIVADGKIPVRDKVSGNYVGKTEEELLAKDEVVTAKELTETLVDNSTKAEDTNVVPIVDIDDDDLPF